MYKSYYWVNNGILYPNQIQVDSEEWKIWLLNSYPFKFILPTNEWVSFYFASSNYWKVRKYKNGDIKSRHVGKDSKMTMELMHSYAVALLAENKI
jgi:hypothetical protein